jgi:hypothetical protein
MRARGGIGLFLLATLPGVTVCAQAGRAGTDAVATDSRTVLFGDTANVEASQFVLSAGPHVRTLVLDTNVPAALVFVDSVLVGRAEHRVFAITPTARVVQLAAPTPGTWSITPIAANIPAPQDALAGDTVAIELRFPYHYFVNSRPYGAAVRVTGDSARVVGHTPVTFQLPEPAYSGFEISLAGYHDAVWSPKPQLWSTHVVELEPLDERVASPVIRDMDGRRWWIDAAALGVAGASAAAGIHYKFKADRRYEVYQTSGDPSLRPEIKRLDVRSGVALGVMQAALGVLVVRLIID